MESYKQIFSWLLIAAVVCLSYGASPALNTNYNLNIKLENSGDLDGTYTLGCNPAAGTHPNALAACQAINTAVASGVKPFATNAGQEMCTMQYGGPNEATVTGTWAGVPVNAVFRRTNGCEISRWNKLAALLLTP